MKKSSIRTTTSASSAPFFLPPRTINMDLMTAEELNATFQKGYDDAKAGRVRNAAEAFSEFQRSHQQ
ncbi:MAG: hypothetical protein UEX93_09085 [Peptococcaceae bacterium]|nr:hypothetical protein [Peptococcaceae bacterium]